MVSQPKISIVLGTYNRLQFLKLAIQSIRDEQKRIACDSEIIVIDGGSTDKTIKWLTKQKDIISIIQHNRGTWKNKPIKRRSWGYFMNLGFKCAQGKYICMLSDDSLVVPGAIQNGYELFEEKLRSREKIGAMAFYWRGYGQDKQYHIGVDSNKNIFVNHGLYLKQALKEVNYIDEESYLFYCADGDVCIRMLAKGYKCTASPSSYIEHYPHANMKVRNSNFINVHQDVAHYKKQLQTAPKNHAIIKDEFKDYSDKTETGKLFKKAEKYYPEIYMFKIKRWLLRSGSLHEKAN